MIEHKSLRTDRLGGVRPIHQNSSRKYSTTQVDKSIMIAIKNVDTGTETSPKRIVLSDKPKKVKEKKVQDKKVVARK